MRVLVSAREAAELFRKCGVSRRQAVLVLRSGLAGTPERTAGAHLYDRQRVEQLCGWPTLRADEVAQVGPVGAFVGRRAVQPPVTLHAVAAGWDISPWSRLSFRGWITQTGALPFICTVGGFVALGADLVGLTFEEDRSTRLELEPPGEWFGAVRGHRLLLGRGGPWVHVERRRLDDRDRVRAWNARYGTRY